MTDLATDAPDTSTVLDAEPLGGPSGAGEPSKLPDQAPSLRDTITEAMKEEPKEEVKPDAADPKPDAETDKKAAEKGAEKPQDGKEDPEAKETPKERGADGKFTAKQPEGEAKPEDQGEEGRGSAKQLAQSIASAPKHFLPDAKEKWANTPQPVRREIETMTRQHEAEVAKYREAAERYEPIRQFDEIVRQNGRAGVHETLAEVAQLEELMEKNPLAGLNAILRRAGPTKPDGNPYSLYELAEAIVKSGQDNYNRAVSAQPQQQQQRGPDPEVAQLKQQLARMQQQTIETAVIAPFKASHPRYDELQDDIALFLQSGRIPASLSPLERLEAAYDMAVRINPASHAAADEPKADPVPGDRAAPDFSGSKSIKSAPGAVSPDLEPDRGGSTRDIIRAEMKRRQMS